MFSEKFFKVGEKLDDLIYVFKGWIAQRIWYSPYAYFRIKRWIKQGKFTNDEHFNRFMDMVTTNSRIWNRHYNKLYMLYNSNK